MNRYKLLRGDGQGGRGSGLALSGKENIDCMELLLKNRNELEVKPMKETLW